MSRLLFFVLLGLTVWWFLRAVTSRPRSGGPLEPDFQRFEDFVEVISSDEARALSDARRVLDAAGIPTMVAAATIQVPRSRLDEARSLLAKPAR